MFSTVIGRNKPGSSTRRRYATVSYIFSFIGIITGIILIIVLSMTLIGSNPTCDSDEYYDSGSKKCCEYNRCWYGTSYYVDGCLKCCEYNNYYCGSAGSISIPMDASSAARQNLVALMAPISIPMDAHSVARSNLAANTMVPITIPTDASNAASFRIRVSTVLRLWIHSVECAVPRRITRDDIINPVLLPINQSENRMERKCILI